MKKIKIILCFMMMIFSASVCLAEKIMSVDKAIKKTFKDAVSWESASMVLTEEEAAQIAEASRITFGDSHARNFTVYTVKSADALLGYALEDTVIGKWGPIHYLVGIDLNGKILRTSILGMYEIRGRKATKNRFLKQYKDKSIKNPIRLRKDIDGISGATITSRSLTDGVRKLIHIFEMKKNEL